MQPFKRNDKDLYVLTYILELRYVKKISFRISVYYVFIIMTHSDNIPDTKKKTLEDYRQNC